MKINKIKKEKGGVLTKDERYQLINNLGCLETCVDLLYLGGLNTIATMDNAAERDEYSDKLLDLKIKMDALKQPVFDRRDITLQAAFDLISEAEALHSNATQIFMSITKAIPPAIKRGKGEPPNEDQ